MPRLPLSDAVRKVREAVTQIPEVRDVSGHRFPKSGPLRGFLDAWYEEVIVSLVFGGAQGQEGRISMSPALIADLDADGILSQYFSVMIADQRAVVVSHARETCLTRASTAREAVAYNE